MENWNQFQLIWTVVLVLTQTDRLSNNFMSVSNHKYICVLNCPLAIHLAEHLDKDH